LAQLLACKKDTCISARCNGLATNNKEGIWLAHSSEHNSIKGNTITSNSYEGILLDSSSDNSICHNNFVNNTHQVYYIAAPVANFWDDGYPSGGNYWSDYVARYPNAIEIDALGIWNVPYVIDANNTDHYPFTKLYIRLVGDVNGDGKVDMRDVGYMARRFMCVPGDQLWDSTADLNGDERINMTDIGTAARHFGEHYP
jgi:parallel beta-helix repeat protein